MDRRYFLGFASAASVTGFAMPGFAAPIETLGQNENRYLDETMRAGGLSLLMSEVAVRNVTREDVRRFAHFEISEQQTMADVLATVKKPSRLSGDLSPPNDDEVKSHLGKDEQRELEKLTAGVYGAQYDRNYLRSQHEGHQKLLNIQDTHLKEGKLESLIFAAKLARAQTEDTYDSSKICSAHKVENFPLRYSAATNVARLEEYKMKTVIVLVLGCTTLASQVYAADNTTTTTSGAGVQGALGNKNGPAAKPATGSGSSSSSSSSGSTTSPGNLQMNAVPSQDASGMKGSPGNKNGPAAQPPK